MSNSSRWRRLCEWVRHLQDTNGEVDLPSLMKKMEEIKLGGGDYVQRENALERKSKTNDR